jgi:hypothetical protein
VTSLGSLGLSTDRFRGWITLKPGGKTGHKMNSLVMPVAISSLALQTTGEIWGRAVHGVPAAWGWVGAAVAPEKGSLLLHQDRWGLGDRGESCGKCHDHSLCHSSSRYERRCNVLEGRYWGGNGLKVWLQSARKSKHLSYWVWFLQSRKRKCNFLVVKLPVYVVELIWIYIWSVKKWDIWYSHIIHHAYWQHLYRMG